MKKEKEFAVEKFREAVNSLKEGVSQARSQLEKDGVIQRFEFTFELLWKTLKVVLEDQGIQAKTPKESLRAAFQISLITDEEIYLDMLQARNKMSHLYNKEESDKIFSGIKTKYLPEVLLLLDRLSAPERGE